MGQLIYPKQLRVLDEVFDDVEQLCSQVVAWNLDFRPFRSGQTKDIGRLLQFQIGEFDHGYARFRVPLDQSGEPPANKTTFTILGDQTRILWWRGHQVDAFQVLVFEEGATLDSYSGDDFETHVISVPTDTLASICEAYEIPLPTVTKQGTVFRPQPSPLQRVRSKLNHLNSGMGSRFDYEKILEDLVVAWAGFEIGVVTEDNSVGRNNKNQAMRRCLHAIDEDDDLLLSAKRLREISGVGVRTLEYAFKERFGIGPAGFLKAKRLTRARTLLATGDGPGSSVSAAMETAGFWHVGQFAKDYKNAFAETPSETLNKYRVCSWALTSVRTLKT